MFRTVVSLVAISCVQSFLVCLMDYTYILSLSARIIEVRSILAFEPTSQMFRTVASLLAVGQGIELEARCNPQTKSKLGRGEDEVIHGRCVNVGNDKADSIDFCGSCPA